MTRNLNFSFRTSIKALESNYHLIRPNPLKD